MLEAIGSYGWKPAQLEREENHEHQAQPEDGQGGAEEGEEHAQVVEFGILFHPCDDAGRHSQNRCDQNAGKGKYKGIWKPRHNLSRNRKSCPVRGAEISFENISNKKKVLFHRMFIQPELNPDLLD